MNRLIAATAIALGLVVPVAAQPAAADDIICVVIPNENVEQEFQFCVHTNT